jgi:hypothetical protein
MTGCYRRPAVVALCALVTAAAAGCYEHATPTPAKAKLPTLVDGQEVELALNKSEEADVSGSRVRFYDNYRVDGMTYGDEHLTYNQVRALADPKWNHQLDEHARLVSACHRANIPRYVGYTAMVAALGMQIYGGLLLGENYAKYQQVGAYGLMGFGGLSYLTGYALFGGRKCVEANEMYGKLHMRDAGETTLYNDEQIAELAQIVLDFNKRQQNAAKAGDGDEDESDDDSDDDDEASDGSASK